MSVSQILSKRISSLDRGSVFCANDFVEIGARGNIDLILHRLAKQRIIRFLGYGLYDLPQKSEVLGDLNPTIANIMNAYSRKMRQQFVLNPLNAANAMGFTTQVPAKLTYLTDGKSHILNVCGIEINLVHASPKMMAGAATSVGVIIQALRYFKPHNVPDNIIYHIAGQLSKDDLNTLLGLRNHILRNLVVQVDRINKVAKVH